MTTVTRSGSVWYNQDGLNVKFGAHSADDAVTGAPTNMAGGQQILVVDFDYTRLPAAGAIYLYGDEPKCGIPVGAVLDSVDWQTDTAFDSTNDDFTLDVGICDRAGTIIDDNAIVVAATQTEINANTAYSATNQGASVPSGGGVSTIATYNSLTAAVTPVVYITAQASVHTATAGHARMVIKYHVPSDDSGGAYSV